METDSAAAQAHRLTRLVEHTRDLLLRVLTAVNTGGCEDIVFAASALKDMRPVLAAVEATAGMLAEARRAGRREGWYAGFEAGIAAQGHPERRGAHLRALPEAN